MFRFSRRSLRGIRSLLVAVSALSACDSPLEPDFEPAVPDVTDLVTLEIREHLDSNGHFVFPLPTSPGTRPIISSADASDLAVAFLNTFVRDADTSLPPPPNGLHLRDVLERQHGRSVDWSMIAAAPRGAYFAATPYEPLPEDFDEVAHRHFGPHFLVPVLVDGHQVVVVAVAAYATEYSVGGGGDLLLPDGDAGGAFDASGILYSHPYRYPIAPEAAVTAVVKRFGPRVDGVPRLLQNGLRGSPGGVRWELPLEVPAEVRFVTSGEIARTDRLYVGQWPSLVDPTPDGGPFLQLRFFVADDDQPASELLSRIDPESGERTDVEVRYLKGIPVRFLEVEPTQ